MKNIHMYDKLPNDAYLHGRAGRQTITNPVFCSRSWEVAEQYAGAKGSIWLIQPKRTTKHIDTESKKDQKKVFRKYIKDYKDGYLSSDQDSIVLDILASPDPLDAFVSVFAPNNLVESGGLWDVSGFTVWAYDRIGIDMAYTARECAVVLDHESVFKAIVIGSASK
jgi:hypothetical protein